MFHLLANKVFGSRNQRYLKQAYRQVAEINALEADLKQHTDSALQESMQTLRQRAQDGEALDKLLPEVFAIVREASVRILGMRHFDVQLIGGMVLHEGRIAEMKTGEGKTLVATLPACLNALTGRGIHVVTVNDYLARRDSAWMRPLYEFLGFSSGFVIPGLSFSERHSAYQSDICYATNNELGFDYLRDNMALEKSQRVQRERFFAIVDEVDSILVDEARTPLIISGPAEDNIDSYLLINRLIPRLEKQQESDGPGDYSVDEKNKNIALTEAGHEKIEALLVEEGLLDAEQSLYDPRHIGLLHHVHAALRAHALYERDVDYIVQDGVIVIVDEFTGRTMPGRRWSEGLHQAIEAKENVPVQRENQTLASITFQNYFRLYKKLSGMTGTADTEAYEFQQIYGLEVIVVPTHQRMIREDHPDLVFLNEKQKFHAIAEEIAQYQKRGQPVLVGTTSIENSERLSTMLQKNGVKHHVLNAKQHQKEASIIANAGCFGVVTIATNMAGRGTDIVLGGTKPQLAEASEEAEAAWQSCHQQVLAVGGLHIIGTERHESRRVDNQLRGRSGRQGDPGSSRFYLSLEDPLMRIFASEWVSRMMQRMGMEEGEAIEHKMVSRAIENAQRKVEAHHFDIRKNLLEYDDVANEQRKLIYEQRDALILADDIGDWITDLQSGAIEDLLSEYWPEGGESPVFKDLEQNLGEALERHFGQRLGLAEILSEHALLEREGLVEKLRQCLQALYQEKEQQLGAEILRRFEKLVMLRVLDQHWKEHLAAMDYLRQSVSLRGYAQKNPKQEYKREAFVLFSNMLDRIRLEAVGLLVRLRIEKETVIAAEKEEEAETAALMRRVEYRHAQPTAPAATKKELSQPFVREQPKQGRNQPCWCGSGKKYKHCHGAK